MKDLRIEMEGMHHMCVKVREEEEGDSFYYYYYYYYYY